MENKEILSPNEDIKTSYKEDLNPILFSMAETTAILQISNSTLRTLIKKNLLETENKGIRRVYGKSILNYLKENPLKK